MPVDKETKNLIARLLYFQKEINTIVDNAITEEILRGREFKPEDFKDHILYRLNDAIDALTDKR